MKKVLIIIVAVLILTIAYIFLKGIYIQGCDTDSDCVVKSTGCNCCGHTYTCTNKYSVERLCLSLSPARCLCENPVPISCKCVNNKCQPTNILR